VVLSDDASVLFVTAQQENGNSSGVDQTQFQSPSFSHAGAAYMFATALSSNTACRGIPDCICTGKQCTASGNVEISGSTLQVSTLSSLVVTGNLVLFPNSTTSLLLSSAPNSIPFVMVNGSAAVNGTLTIVVGAISSSTVVLLSAGSITGTFTSFSVTSSDPCTSVSPPSSPVYSSSTISISIITVNACSGLTSGALAGVIVGSVVGGLTVALVIVLVSRYFLRRGDLIANAAIKKKELADVNAMRVL
jgi:hypothetical protein